MNKGSFCNNSKIETLISKRLSVENKVKLSQLEIVKNNTAEEVFWVSSWDFRLFSADNRFEISVPISLLLQNPLLVERVLLCSLQIIALKLVCQFRYCYKICPCCSNHTAQQNSGYILLLLLEATSGYILLSEKNCFHQAQSSSSC